MTAPETLSVPDPIAAAMAAERALHDPAVRASRDALAGWLDPAFTEIGASGRFWTRDELLAELPVSAALESVPIVTTELRGVLLGPGLVHLTYLARVGERRSRRSSLWRCGADGCRLLFHQGTPC